MEFSTQSFQDRIAGWLGGGDIAEWAAFAIVLGLMALLGVVLWRLNLRLTKGLHAGIDNDEGRFVRGLSIQKQRIFTRRQTAFVLHWLVRWASRLVNLLVVLFVLNLIFSQFDWSRQAALSVVMYIGDILGGMVSAVIDYLPNLVVVIIVITLARMVVKFLQAFFDGVERERINLPGFYPEWARTSFGLARLFVIALTVIIVFPYLPGSDSPAFQGLSIFFGVLLSLGSSSAIANIISGVVITYTRAFRMGDRVRIADTEGDVIERSAFVTRIKTPKNVEVAIPNSMVMSDHIINYSAQALESGVLLHTTVTIGYDVPWTQVHDILKAAARRTDNLEKEPEAFVLQTSLDDNYVAYELNAYTRCPNGKPKIYSELHAHIQDGFRDAGVEILSPHYRANRDGDPLTIPPPPAKPDAADD